jgi:hypothetical protein
MKSTIGSLAVLLALSVTPVYAQSAPAPQTQQPAGAPGAPGSHDYDPCAMVSQANIAAAAGVAVNQVSTPASPTKNECMWAVANKSGLGAQQIALTVQTVDQVKQAHGIARFGAVLAAVQQIPGVPMPNNPIVTRAFADAQVVTGLGDKAGWKSGTLSVLKSETLYQVSVSNTGTDPNSGKGVAISVATAALNNTDTTKN